MLNQKSNSSVARKTTPWFSIPALTAAFFSNEYSKTSDRLFTKTMEKAKKNLDTSEDLINKHQEQQQASQLKP